MLAVDAWMTVLRLTRKTPFLLVPFLLVGAAETYFLLLVYLTPHFSALIDSQIRLWVGGAFASYPLKWLVLPAVFDVADIPVSVFLVPFMAGWVVVLVHGRLRRGPDEAALTLRRLASRYLSLVLISIVTASASLALVKFASVGMGWLRWILTHGSSPAMAAWQSGLTCLSFVLVTGVQAVSVYAVPVSVLEDRSAVPSLSRSLAVFRQRPLTTVLLVSLPGALYFSTVALKGLIPELMMRHGPTAGLAIMVANVLVAALMGYLITASATTVILDATPEGAIQPDRRYHSPSTAGVGIALSD